MSYFSFRSRFMIFFILLEGITIYSISFIVTNELSLLLISSFLVESKPGRLRRRSSTRNSTLDCWFPSIGTFPQFKVCPSRQLRNKRFLPCPNCQSCLTNLLPVLSPISVRRSVNSRLIQYTKVA